jgi:hypothetical protein
MPDTTASKASDSAVTLLLFAGLVARIGIGSKKAKRGHGQNGPHKIPRCEWTPG